MWLRRRSARRLAAIAVISLGVATVAGHTALAQEVEGPRETGRIRVRNLGEVSGLAVSRKNPDVIWVHNDGGRKQVFAVTTSGMLSPSTSPILTSTGLAPVG